MSSAITPIIMPKWGLEMREGTVSDWLVEVGTRIHVGMPILDVETDKLSNSVEAPDAGLLRRRIAQAGETLPVRALLGVMAESEVSEADIDAFVAAFEVPAVGADDEDSGPSYDYAEVEGIRVRYARRGPEEGVPLVLLHGFGGDLGNWLFNIDALAESFPVIALDLPAHGQSQAKLPAKSIAGLADFVAQLLQQIGANKVHIGGHSMGGAIATQFALTQPQRTASLTLICSAGLGHEINTGYTDGFIAASNKRELKTVVEQLFANPELVTRSLVDDLLKYKRMDGVPEALEALGQSLFSQGKQTETPGLKLQGNAPPLLVIWGAQDQVISAQHAANAPAGSTVAVLEGAGHMVMLEKANEVNALIKKHIASH